MRLRRTEHTGGSHLAGRPNHRHGLLGCGLRLVAIFLPFFHSRDLQSQIFLGETSELGITGTLLCRAARRFRISCLSAVLPRKSAKKEPYSTAELLPVRLRTRWIPLLMRAVGALDEVDTLFLYFRNIRPFQRRCQSAARTWGIWRTAPPCLNAPGRRDAGAPDPRQPRRRSHARGAHRTAHRMGSFHLLHGVPPYKSVLNLRTPQ